jgi:hypothetical protein
MGFALVVFLGAVPAVLFFFACRAPSESSLRRLFATVGVRAVPHQNEGTAEVVSSRLRRRRAFGVAGATLGLWATATWSSASTTWNGLIPVLSETQLRPIVAYPGAALSTSALTFYSASFVLTASTYGILIGYMIGIVLAEWTGRPKRDASRAALLAPHDARHYLVSWATEAVMVAGVASLVALAAVYAIDDADTMQTLGVSLGYSPHFWWALALIAVGVIALLTRWVVLSSGSRAAVADDLAAREITRALTAATMTVVALAAFVASTASTLTLISIFFLGDGPGGEFGTATAALVLLFVALGLEVAAFVTPYWLIAVEIDEPALVAP